MLSVFGKYFFYTGIRFREWDMDLFPCWEVIFELAARSAIVMAAAGRTTFQGVCLADPAAWIAALIPLVPYYFYTMRKWKDYRDKNTKADIK